MSENTEQIREFILREFLPGEKPENLTNTTELITSGIIDSLATLRLVTFLEDSLGVVVEAHEMGPENLNTVELIDKFVASKKA